ncbi:hypothetical protein HJC23_003812 [Cyclotella cryptica]|uniref:Uncharacterized protein n=1 Tax=Cyclotella cryptica TaxID=29204 RepID=A0ABD3PZ54_9STRA
MILENATCAEGGDDGLNSDLEPSKATIATNITASNNTTQRFIAPENKTTRKKSSRIKSHKKWRPDNFERDYQILQTALARHNSISDLQQRQRKYTLDYGFAKRPLLKDALSAIFNIGAWTALLTICGKAGFGGFTARSDASPWWRKICFLFTEAVISMTTLHYWVVVMTLPLVYLTWAKWPAEAENNSILKSSFDQQNTPQRGRFIRKWISGFGSAALILDAYFEERQYDSRRPAFFYSSDFYDKTAKSKDTKDYVLCMLENWTSAILASFIWRVLSTGSSLVGRARSHRQYFIAGSSSIAAGTELLPTLSRLITRIGAAAALYQYPSLLFELRRNDQPRPLCRPTLLMQRAVDSLFCWMYVGISADFALLLESTFDTRLIESASGMGLALTGFFLSIIGPVCHIFALMKLIRLSKCRAIPLSQATSFPNIHCDSSGETGRTIDEPSAEKWRYQIRWRTPHRVSETLRNWAIFLLTNHKPLVTEMDEWKNLVRSNGFSTEGRQFKGQSNENDELVVHKDEIVESLSLILRDRDAAITNATQARSRKYQESYETNESDDVLGTAIQQTFGIGLSYSFDHFDTPPNDEQISIHQLRARMAKSAIRLKNSLDNSLLDELALLHRLENNVSTEKNYEIAKREMELAEQEIRGRHKNKIDRIKTALMTMIPTNAVPPEGTENVGSPIMIAEYVNLTASVDRRDLKASTLEAPNPLEVVEDYIRKDFGEEAAEAFREREIAFRMKERNMLNELRQRHGKLSENDEDLTSDSSDDGLLLAPENE